METSLPCSRASCVEGFLGHGEHAAGAAGAVVDAVGGVADVIGDGQKIRLAMSFTTSRGVKCSPASSLFSSLNRRISSSKIVPMAWLSRPGRRTLPSWSNTGSGLRLTSLEVNFSMRLPRMSASTSVGSGCGT